MQPRPYESFLTMNKDGRQEATAKKATRAAHKSFADPKSMHEPKLALKTVVADRNGQAGKPKRKAKVKTEVAATYNENSKHT